jgi:glycosyltransferase involved in cell wall biosynthesis
MPLTVVQTLPALESGGVERGTLEVARALVQAGHRSIVISGGGRLVDLLRQTGSEHVTWPVGAKSPLTFRFVPKLRQLLREQNADILHARSRLPAWISFFAWRGMPAKHRPRFVTTMHGAHGVNRYSRIMSRGERVIAVSDYIREHLLDNYPGIDARNIRVIPRGVDPVQYPYGYRPAEGWIQDWLTQNPQLKDKQLVTLPARLSRRKGQTDLIEIMAILRRRETLTNLHGLIVGGAGPQQQKYEAELRQRIHAANLEQHITLLGHRDDVREIMAISRIVLSLSNQPEAFGRTMIEALSMGLPVIGYAHGGITEILGKVYPDGLVPACDIGAACDKLAAFIDDPPVVPRTHPYTLDHMLDATLALYRELASAPGE